MTDLQTETKPNGPVAAVFTAAGIGSFTMGLTIVLGEMSEAFNDFLQFDSNFGIGSGVGGLSGRATIATLAFLASWIALHLVWRGRELDFSKVLMVSLILVGLGFALTFPPIFTLFAPAE